jgi:hypothetical protein
MPEVTALEDDIANGANPPHVALGTLDTGVVRVLVGRDLLRVDVVAGIGTESDAVGIVPHGDGDHAQYDETEDKCPPGQQGSPQIAPSTVPPLLGFDALLFG